jgi:AraC-like DNA-binding protein
MSGVKKRPADRPEPRGSGRRADTSLRHEALLELAEGAVRRRLVISASIAAVAKHLGVSRSHLSRTYAQRRGQPFGDFVMKWRRREVNAALANPRITVKEVSAWLLFKNADYFACWCRRNLGCAPSEHRARCRDRAQGVNLASSDTKSKIMTRNIRLDKDR